MSRKLTFSRNRGTGRGKSSQTGPRPQKLQRNEVIENGIPGYRALKYRCKLNYYDQITLSTGAGSAGTYIYSCNGLYDPDITSTGHQPMPFDSLMLSYEHYCVTSAVCTVNFKNASTTNTIGVSISLNAGQTPITVVQQLVENGVLVRDRLPVSPSSDTIKTLSMPTRIGKFGSVPQLLDNPEYNGSVAGNPVEQSYFHISAWCPDGVSVVSGIVCEVFIVYDAWFFEPRKNSVSLNRQLRDLIIAEEKDKPALECKRAQDAPIKEDYNIVMRESDVTCQGLRGISSPITIDRSTFESFRRAAFGQSVTESPLQGLNRG